MYVQRNIEAHSLKYGCCGKARSIAYTECVFVASCTQRAKSTPAWLYHFSPHYLTNGTIFGEKIYRRENVFFLYSPNFLSKYSAF